MGVLTVMYSIPPRIMKKIQADNERLGFVTGDAEDDDGGDWRCASIDFDKHYVEVVGLLRDAGHEKAAAMMDIEANAGELELDPYDLLWLKPKQVKQLDALLEGLTPAALKKQLKGKEPTDYYGKSMSADDIASYLSEIPRIRKLLKVAVAEESSIVVTEA